MIPDSPDSFTADWMRTLRADPCVRVDMYLGRTLVKLGKCSPQHLQAPKHAETTTGREHHRLSPGTEPQIRVVSRSRPEYAQGPAVELFASHLYESGGRTLSSSASGRAPVPSSSLPFPSSAGEADVSALDRAPFVSEQKEHEDLLVLSEAVPIFTLWYTILQLMQFGVGNRYPGNDYITLLI